MRQALGSEPPWRDVACLILLSLVVRVPFFFRAVVDWDESTMILVAQSLLDGHLPYTELWDNKPPLAFVFYAVPIALFGRSIAGVRLAGVVGVVIAALLTYRIGARMWNRRAGLLGAACFVLLASTIPGGQGTMSEHIALPPLLGSLALLISRDLTARALFLAGALMGIASLVRLNLAYVGLTLGVFVILRLMLDYKPWRDVLRGVSAYASGVIVTVVLTFVPYAATGQQAAWWSSVILAPLAFSSNLGRVQALVDHAYYLRLHRALVPLNVFVWGGGILASARLMAQWRQMSVASRRHWALFFTFLLGTGVAVLSSGASHPHYLIQLAPFMGLLAAVFADTCLSGRRGVVVAAGILLAMLVSMKALIVECGVLTSRVLAGQTLSYGRAYDIASILRQEGATREPIYITDDNIVYWLIGSKPMSRAVTHPSNLAKEHLLSVVVGAGASAESEMASILERRPRFIVRTKVVWYMADVPAAQALLEESLDKDYQLTARVNDRLIYRRKS